ncbi:hypothetical protein CEXT_793271 [Caerostris extrusa]|uniref:Uncharacterized protein n=1 Tax=Caerostris extrusa TaxID=172846 RepID=A0AAV4SRH7_CAEEX|nr:hypothetical protein CEXT_793271 [Caerostris extrusa]
MILCDLAGSLIGHCWGKVGLCFLRDYRTAILGRQLPMMDLADGRIVMVPSGILHGWKCFSHSVPSCRLLWTLLLDYNGQRLRQRNCGQNSVAKSRNIFHPKN